MAIGRPMRIVAALGAAAAVTCGVAACGGGTPTFSADGMAIHFKYPGDLKERHGPLDLRHVGARGVAARKAIVIDRDNFLLIEKYKVTIPTTKANLPELGDAADQIVSGLFRRQLTGTRTSLNGIPTVSYRALSGGGTTSLVSYAFLEGGAYELDCEWNATHESQIRQACRQMKRTLTGSS